MVTTIQVDENTQKRLFAKVAELEAQLGRRVSYDEVISLLLDESGEAQQAKVRLARFFGALKNDKKAWAELRRLRKEEETRLGRLARTS